MTQEQRDAVEEFRYCAREYLAEPSSGARHALKMAVAECGLLGVNTSEDGVPAYILTALLEADRLRTRLAEAERLLGECCDGMDETERRWDGLTRSAMAARSEARAFLQGESKDV